LILALIAGLSASSLFDPDFKWFAGVFAMALGVTGLFWHRFYSRWGSARSVIRSLDWDTTIFLIGVFIVVGALSYAGWLETLAHMISEASGESSLRAYLLIVGLAVVVSAFVDNVPFLLAMIPVTQTVANRLGASVPFLMFGLLIGSCLGGNITPIGASANIVAIGILRKEGHLVSFREFMSIGIPFTLAAVIAASAALWMLWGG